MYHNEVIHLALLLVAIIIFILAFVPIVTSRNIIAIGLAIFAAAFLFGCTAAQKNGTTPIVSTGTMPASVQGSAGGKAITDLSTDAQQALAGFAAAKSGNANLVWSLGQMFEAYSNESTTQADVKALIAQWTASTSTPIATKIADIFGQTSGTPLQKMQALANAAFAVAGNVTTSP